MPPERSPPPLTQTPRLLLLGGTTEANRLAVRLARHDGIATTLSLAGRTAAPVLPPGPCRIGGFGGAEGLARYLATEGIAAVLDATHPFAARITANAALACARLGLPHAIFTRPPWTSEPEDRWIVVANLQDAARAIGPAQHRVLLTSGRLGLAAFRSAPQHHYVVRSIDPPAADDCPPRHTVILDRGPFTAEAETALMRREAIDVVVTKNSGGPAGKIAAARALGLKVIMVERPPAPRGTVLLTLDAAEDWLAAHVAAP